MMLLRRVRTKPFEYARKAISPYWWVRWFERCGRQRVDIKESQRIHDMLIKMNAGSYDDAVSNRNSMLLQILQYAGNHCEYYRNVFHQVNFNTENLDDFERLPLLDKPTIRHHFKDLTSTQIDKMNFYTMNTGGSTGEPLEFLVASVAALVDSVHQEFVFRTFMQYQPNDMIVAFDGSSVPEKSLASNVFWVPRNSHDIPYGRLSYSSLHLKRDTIQYYVGHLLDTAPCILRGYPSFINDIAEYVLENGISIPFQIKGIQLTAENAYDWQIQNIERAFNTKVFLQYGHSEVSVYGYTFDDTQEYYCSPFYGYTEVLGKDGKHVHQGEVGEVVVTGFHNFAMPFIRYRTGDLALFNGEANGIVRLGKIVGRIQDHILAKNGEKISLTALIFGQHYRAFANIQKWQLLQDIPGKVRIRIVKGVEFSQQDESEIQDKFKNICDVDTEFDYVDSIPLTSRGKFRFLIQNVAF